MTYCIAASINEGLILVSDSRTNAGIDNVSTHGKMHAFNTTSDRKIVLLCAGNLATTQAVLEQLHRDKLKNTPINFNTVDCLSAAAAYLGHVSVEKQKQHINAEGQSAFNPSASFILAGQIGDEPHGAFMVYAEGNSITTSANTPFLQIGESKYGKPILDRFLRLGNSIDEAARCCLVSMDSTIRSNASVGPPVELLIYRKDSFSLDEYYSFEGDDDYMLQLRRCWENKLREAIAALPDLDKESAKSMQIDL
ncbi:putative proteasome-type protease [Candidatus Methylobacter favarea]|uniref:Putative proteasome-type protease n=1 Tax=Candidatus Methylobacter favarea TaxID=2707345 RepID=A0A8S0WAK3_9GAMM|nr:peptidase [Candidatus Methylobacter favarea]CAA9890819.1 putative proteasome-type protease [Candidatus Methylobacter favarea]